MSQVDLTAVWWVKGEGKTHFLQGYVEIVPQEARGCGAVVGGNGDLLIGGTTRQGPFF